MQIPDFWKYYKKSKLDGLLWMATFIGVVFTTVDMGLIICLAMTVFVMTYRNYQINIIEIDQAAGEEDSDDENEDTNDDPESAEENILALKLIGVVSFANYEKILKQLNKRLRRQREKMKTDDDEKPVIYLLIQVSVLRMWLTI